MLTVPTVIADRYPRPGDARRRRCKSLQTHSPVWTDDLPYMPFPEHWPIYSPNDQLANYLANCADIIGVNFWGNTNAENAIYDEA